MIVRGMSYIKCDECSHSYVVDPTWTDREIRNVAGNDGWYYTKNGTDWCEQCTSTNKRQGE